ILNNVGYEIDAQSNLIINGYLWTPSQLKQGLNLDSNPTRLTIKNDSLFTSEKLLGKLGDIKTSMEKLLTTQEQKDRYNLTQQTYQTLRAGFGR
ncbi:hypothetical protein EBU71_16095, partial [bacterium]|nr:hypothetical protein [Candidatus Elulimicrobium humile]